MSLEGNGQGKRGQQANNRQLTATFTAVAVLVTQQPIHGSQNACFLLSSHSTVFEYVLCPHGHSMAATIVGGRCIF